MRTYAIDPLHFPELTDAEWQAFCDLLNAFRLAIEPLFAPLDVDEARRRYLNVVEFYRDDYWWVHTPAGELVGWLRTGRFTGGEHNRHLLDFDIVIDEAQRRQGIGSALLALVVDAAERDGLTLLTSFANTRVPAGEPFLRRIGGEPGLRSVTSDLLLDDLDRELQQHWIDRAPERAADYELVEITSPYPDALLEPLAALQRLMNTAPREDLDMEDIPWTPEQVREMDEDLIRRGGRRFMVAARHRPGGELVGFTDIIHYDFQPHFLWQWETAVAGDHQNKGLGRWLKAANLLRAMKACPAATRVRTGNAGSNAPMLKINRQMGFREVFANIVFQIPVEKARAYLTERAPMSPLP